MSLRLVARTSLLEHLEQSLEHARNRHFGCGRKRGDALDYGGHRAAYDLLEQLLLVVEVEIERSLGDAGLGSHVVEPCRLETALGEHRERGVENNQPPFCRFQFAGTASFLWRRAGSSDRTDLRLAFLEGLAHATPISNND